MQIFFKRIEPEAKIIQCEKSYTATVEKEWVSESCEESLLLVKLMFKKLLIIITVCIGKETFFAMFLCVTECCVLSTLYCEQQYKNHIFVEEDLTM